MKKIYIIHENSEWIEPLRTALEELSLPYEEWFINEGLIDLDSLPPEGVFYNRMSASSHTRAHRYAVELTGPILAWLESAGRRVVNNRRALQLEVRKFEQYIALKAAGIKVPKTIAANGMAELNKAVKKLGHEEYILKPNRGGKGAGVQLIKNGQNLAELFEAHPDLRSLDGINLIQEYIKPVDQSITRVEFIGGKFHYAVRVDTSQGFELCPADACAIDDAFCPTDEPVENTTTKAKFEIIENYKNDELPKYDQFFAANGMEVAALEYVMAENGQRYVYDVNTNTNYNSAAETVFSGSLYGMKRIAEFLGEELKKI